MFEFLLQDPPDAGFMPIIEREPNIPSPQASVRDDISARAETAQVLAQLGEEVTVSEEDNNRALELFDSARTPSPYERNIPGVMLKLEALLTEYDHHVVKDADQIRRYVTNRLIEESENDSATIRLRALEMLGKISDVGLFSDKKEITVRHQSNEELEDILREKLSLLIEGEVEDAELVA